MSVEKNHFLHPGLGESCTCYLICYFGCRRDKSLIDSTLAFLKNLCYFLLFFAGSHCDIMEDWLLNSGSGVMNCFPGR